MTPRRDYLRELANAILQTHGVEALNIETVPVREMWQGRVAWDGDVEVFDIARPSGATRCYGWGYPCDEDPSRYQYVCVLALGPVDSPINAVRAAICAHAEKQKSE